MTIFELEASMHGDFHDALLHSFAVDLVARTAQMRLEVCVGDPGSSDPNFREVRRLGTLLLSGLEYFCVDPPDFTYDRRAPYLVDLCAADPDFVGSGEVTEGTFAARFFSSSTNSFFHFSAASASFSDDHSA